MEKNLLHTETEIVHILREIFDPEIPVNIYDLGLIYDIEIDENDKATITMTLTAPNCPVADSLLAEVKEKVEGVEGISRAEVNLVFDPPWDPNMLSEEAKFDLGML